MAAGGSDNNDGSEIFWPGYVDATTNLILNLLFLLTILIVAVFMFALELGRAVGPQDANADHTAKIEEVAPTVDPVQENVALKKEIERLKILLAENAERQAPVGGQSNVVAGTLPLTEPVSGLEQTVAGEYELMVRFKDEAVSFNDDERRQILEALRPVSAGQKILIQVSVPEGFSEARRMGFYRALAVRNMLIELQVPTGKIDVSVVEGAAGADAAVVRVRSR